MDTVIRRLRWESIQEVNARLNGQTPRRVEIESLDRWLKEKKGSAKGVLYTLQPQLTAKADSLEWKSAKQAPHPFIRTVSYGVAGKGGASFRGATRLPTLINTPLPP